MNKATEERQAALLWARVEPLGLSRREFLILLGSGVGATLAACEAQTPSPPASHTTANFSKPTALGGRQPPPL